MFWGLYPGGLAFGNREEAISFINANQSILDDFSSGWAIYELSGELEQDTYLVDSQRHLNKSLFVVRLSIKL